MAPQNQANSKTVPFTFEPPTGGDITLRSNDGVVFCVHSVILGLASSVFSDMLSIGSNSAEIVDLGDDSEALALMLAFIYPSSLSPTLNTFELLDKSLQIAQKYHMEPMLKTLDQMISQSFNNSLLPSNPVRMFHLCATYGLRESQTLAAKSITSAHGDLRSPKEIIKLAEQHPTAAHLIGLVGIQAARSNILFHVLFEYHHAAILPTLSEYDPQGNLLMCEECWDKTSASLESAGQGYAPSWLFGWASNAFQMLNRDPSDKYSEMFNTSSLVGLGDGEACEYCLDTARQIGYPEGSVFNAWAESVKHTVENELRALDCLYTL
ncbi:hypothetical protein BDV93DRAFT_521262 [Ceratobasidium sp. AG-I]|nr:hypothetical protein BDV93DRAFT_521262 [Ceratobasidium sp. AG-I]